MKERDEDGKREGGPRAKSEVREKGGTRLREDERNKYKTRERERERAVMYLLTRWHTV